MHIAYLFISVFPIILFLGVLIFLDSYKLVRFRVVIKLILIGNAAAITAFGINTFLFLQLIQDYWMFSHYWAPMLEEFLKMVFLIYLIGAGKIGFLIDAAICGFSIGCGFAVFENTYYVYALGEPSFIIFSIRGIGTAVMHGGTTALLAITTKSFFERGHPLWRCLIPGYLLAITIHSLFNHFYISPEATTIFQLIVLPAILTTAFHKSEKSLQCWLGVGFDSDMELLRMLHSGQIEQTRIGQYLLAIKNRFTGHVLADILCFIQIYLELSLRAKGALLMRTYGFKPEMEVELKDKFDEMKFLEKSIGKTGRLAILPFLHVTNKDLWQLYFLKNK